MSSDYTVIAPFYDRLGLSDFAASMAPHLLTFAQQHDWVGRRVLDLGCGTSGATRWFAEHGYSVISVDEDAVMLDQLRGNIGDMAHVDVVQADIRALDASAADRVDMVLAVNTLNDMASLRDVEAVLKGVSAILSAGKYFLFDLQTLYGLAEMGRASDSLIHDESGLVVFRQSAYDFERQVCHLTYDIFAEQTADVWARSRARIVRRAYPVAAVATLAKRHQFELMALVDVNFNKVDVNALDVARVIFMVKKL